MRTLSDLHDGPTDLRTPGALVRSIQRSHQVPAGSAPARARPRHAHSGPRELPGPSSNGCRTPESLAGKLKASGLERLGAP
jgi:hypothetical protein